MTNLFNSTYLSCNSSNSRYLFFNEQWRCNDEDVNQNSHVIVMQNCQDTDLILFLTFRIFFWHLFLNLLTSNEESEKIFNTGQKWSLIFLLLKDYFFRSIPVVSIVIQSYSHIYIYICYRQPIISCNICLDSTNAIAYRLLTFFFIFLVNLFIFLVLRGGCQNTRKFQKRVIYCHFSGRQFTYRKSFV